MYFQGKISAVLIWTNDKQESTPFGVWEGVPLGLQFPVRFFFFSPLTTYGFFF